MLEQYGLAGLFAAAFVAATVLPFQSEALLLALLLAGEHAAWQLLVAASLGNILGSVANWGLGRFLLRFQDRRWFPVRGTTYERARRLYLRWGVWSLLFAWLPFVGDPLTVAAGALRVPLLSFVLLVAVGKTARYAILIAATGSWN